MRLIDVMQFASHSLQGSRARTLLMMLAMSIGVAAVMVLTALGEGARLYVVNQFSSLGSNLVLVFPGAPKPRASVPACCWARFPANSRWTTRGRC